MTKARDLANIISGGFTADDIPNIPASKITSGTFADARIADLSASKLTGSIADARIAASAVSQHATSFDDNNIVNDISTLALRHASSANKADYNTNSMYVDVFQDATGIASHTTSARSSDEYVSSTVETNTIPTGTQLYLKSNSSSNNSTTFTDSSGNNLTVARAGNTKHIVDANSDIIGTSAYWIDGGGDQLYVAHSDFTSRGNFGTGAFTLAGYYRFNSVASNRPLITFGGWGTSVDHEGWSWIHQSNNKMLFMFRSGGSNTLVAESNALSLVADTWYHLAVTRDGSGNVKFWKNGTLDNTLTGKTADINDFSDNKPLKIGETADSALSFAGRFDNIYINKGYDTYTSNFTAPTSYYGLVQTVNATGNFISNAITAPSSVSSMGAIVTYQDNAGTNTLNTDIVLQLSADNGSNFATATLTAMPDFSTGIKMAKVNDLSVTAGTQLKYKISFANQASGSKEARIRGVSLQY